MSRGNVYIGWSKDPSLALALKEKLKAHGYNGIVGGNSESDINVSVGSTIINQMRKCSSAIMLFTTRPLISRAAPGQEFTVLSGNMLYELGFLLGKFDSIGPRRVLIVLLDVPDDIIPTDMRGMWSTHIDHPEQSDSADRILKYFLSEQRSFLVEDKLSMVSEIEAQRDRILAHMKAPAYYHDEMAQIVLLHTMSAYIYDDLTSADMLLAKLQQQSIPNKELEYATAHSRKYFELMRNLVDLNRPDGQLFLAYRDYDDFVQTSLDLIEAVENGTNLSVDFKYLFLSVAYEYLTFANMMYCANLDPDNMDEKLKEFRESCCQKCLDNCAWLIQRDPSRNEELGLLLSAYVTRNMAFFHQSLQMEDFDELFERSIGFRKRLYDSYRFKNMVNKQFVNQIRMEYFLALSDNLYLKTDDLKKSRISELRRYLREINSSRFNRFYLIHTIEERIKQATK